MTWTIERAPVTQRDVADIFDFLRKSYQNFAESRAEAKQHAAARLSEIGPILEKLAKAPLRGTLYPMILPGMRSVTIDRYIFWLVANEQTQTVRLHAIFFGTQDHQRQMLRRMLSDN